MIKETFFDKNEFSLLRDRYGRHYLEVVPINRDVSRVVAEFDRSRARLEQLRTVITGIELRKTITTDVRTDKGQVPDDEARRVLEECVLRRSSSRWNAYIRQRRHERNGKGLDIQDFALEVKTLSNIDLAVMAMSGWEFTAVNITSCNLNGTVIRDMKMLGGCVERACPIQATIDGLELDRVTIDCVDLTRCKIDRLVLSHANIANRGLKVTHAQLDHIEFRGCKGKPTVVAPLPDRSTVQLVTS